MSDRVGVMRLGKLVTKGTPQALRQQTSLPGNDFEDVFFHLAEAGAI